MSVQGRCGREWETELVRKGKSVYEDLCHELIAKKLECCKYIRRIDERQNYNGTVTITVWYKAEGNARDIRRVYTIQSVC